MFCIGTSGKSAWAAANRDWVARGPVPEPGPLEHSAWDLWCSGAPAELASMKLNYSPSDVETPSNTAVRRFETR